MRRFFAGGVLAMTLATAGCAVSTQQEVEMGTQYAAQINQQLPIVTDPEVNRYINVLGDSIARVADSRNLEWHFYVVNSPEVNAFAVPGGYIYINRGLIERAQNMSQVAGVLGHEIGHVTQRHSVQQMQKQQGTNLGLTVGCVLMPSVCNNQAGAAAIQLGAGAVFANFSRKDESEADQGGIGAARVFGCLQREHRKDQEQAEHARGKDGCQGPAGAALHRRHAAGSQGSGGFIHEARDSRSRAASRTAG